MQINVRVVPRAHKNIVEKIDDTNYRVRTTTVPDSGRANKVVQKLLSEYFDVSKSCVKIIKGTKSRQKIIEIDC